MTQPNTHKISTDLLNCERGIPNEEHDLWIGKKGDGRIENTFNKLLYDNSVELVHFRDHPVDRGVSELLVLHKYTAHVFGKPISEHDRKASLVLPDKKSIVLYVWYDNEYGYTKQVIRLAKYVDKVRRKHYY